eukprot:8393905-Ditylum_brightwellii.AAC.1
MASKELKDKINKLKVDTEKEQVLFQLIQLEHKDKRKGRWNGIHKKNQLKLQAELSTCLKESQNWKPWSRARERGKMKSEGKGTKGRSATHYRIKD